MITSSLLIRSATAAALAVSIVFSGPCDASSPTPCNLGKTELQTAPNACCCGVNCECGADCGSGESQSSTPSQTNVSKDSLRDLAHVANSLELTVALSWTVTQPELKSHSNVTELSAYAPTLLSQHTCLQV